MLNKSRFCRRLHRLEELFCPLVNYEGEQWRGKQCSMRRYFYGVKVQLQVSVSHSIRVKFCFVPGSESYVQALKKLPLTVAPESNI